MTSIEGSVPDEALKQVPDSPICASALSKAQQILAPAILNHSLRVFLLAKWLAENERSEWSKIDTLPLLFVASVCHDFGTTDEYNGRQRFEIEGADAATEILRQHSCDEPNTHRVWVAIALHTSPGIAERIEPLARLIRLGVKMDFSKALRENFGATDYSVQIEEYLPRHNIEKVLADAVVGQAVKIPERVDRFDTKSFWVEERYANTHFCHYQTWPDSEKHPKASWPGNLLRAHLLNPDHDGVNLAF